MPQPLANGWQIHSAIDEFSCVRMPELIERADDACLFPRVSASTGSAVVLHDRSFPLERVARACSPSASARSEAAALDMGRREG